MSIFPGPTSGRPRGTPLLIFFLVSSVSLVTSLPRPACAADAITPAKKKEAREHFFAGSRKYDLGRYDEASEEFQKAYEILGDPMILYNVAKSLQYAKNIERALFFYKRYLARSTTAPNRSEVETRIVELTAAMDKVTQSDRIPPTGIIRQNDPTETDVDKTPDHSPDKVPDKTSDKTDVVTKTEPPPPPHNRLARGIGYGLIGLTVAGVAAGAAMLALSSSRSSDFQKLANGGGLTYDDPSLVNYESRSKSYGNAGIACLAIGGAAAIGAGVALYFGFRKAPQSAAAAKNAQVLPFFSPSSGGLLVQGQF